MLDLTRRWREEREKCGCTLCRNSIRDDIYEGRALWKTGMYWQDVVLEHFWFALKCWIFLLGRGVLAFLLCDKIKLRKLRLRRKIKRRYG